MIEHSPTTSFTERLRTTQAGSMLASVIDGTATELSDMESLSFEARVELLYSGITQYNALLNSDTNQLQFEDDSRLQHNPIEAGALLIFNSAGENTKVLYKDFYQILKAQCGLGVMNPAETNRCNRLLAQHQARDVLPEPALDAFVFI